MSTRRRDKELTSWRILASKLLILNFWTKSAAYALMVESSEVGPVRQAKEAPGESADSPVGRGVKCTNPTERPLSPSRMSQFDEPLDITRDPDTMGLGFEAVRLLAAGVALIFIGYLAFNATRIATPGVPAIMLLDAIAGSIAGLIFWLAQTRRVRTNHCDFLSIGLALTVASNVAISVSTLGERVDLQFLMVVVMGGSASIMTVRGLVVILSGSAALGLLAAMIAGPHRFIVDFAFSQTGASIVAVIIFLGRVRGHRRVLGFRLHDAQTNQELVKALDRVEIEFREHQATERHRLDLLEQLRQAQKLEALGTLAGGIAHDINNVIGAITAIASAMTNEMPVGANGRKELQQILVAARRSTTLTRNLVRFARQDQPRSAPFSPDTDVVKEVDALLRRTLAKHVEIKTECNCEGWSVAGDAGLVCHAVMNLCLNSAEAISERGTIVIRTRIVELDIDESQHLGVKPGSYAEISVNDNGHGMSPEVLRRAFEPFFSTKDGQRRSGLGLPMVYGTIQQHLGGLNVQSAPGEGTSIRVVLPAFPSQGKHPEQNPRRRLRVNSLRPVALFVDDEILLRKAAKRMLTGLGYEVLLAGNGREGVERYVEHRHRIGVVLLDVAMPVMSGAECCREIKRLNAEIPVLLTSGFPKGADLQSLLKLPNVRYVQKPYELDDIITNLAALEEGYRNSARISCQVNLTGASKSIPP